jgi:hypothetical protein
VEEEGCEGREPTAVVEGRCERCESIEKTECIICGKIVSSAWNILRVLVEDSRVRVWLNPVGLSKEAGCLALGFHA